MHKTIRRRVRAGRSLENTVTTVGPHDNIFAALELRAADEWLVKAELARAIERIIRDRQLTQVQAARALGVAQPDISNLYRGRLAGYSLERLYRFLTALGQDIRIVVQPKPRSREQATVRTFVRTAGRKSA